MRVPALLPLLPASSRLANTSSERLHLDADACALLPDQALARPLEYHHVQDQVYAGLRVYARDVRLPVVSVSLGRAIVPPLVL